MNWNARRNHVLTGRTAHNPRLSSGRRRCWRSSAGGLAAFLSLALGGTNQPAWAQSRQTVAETRSIAMELYVDASTKGGDVQTWVEAAAKKQPGVGLRVYDLSATEGGGQERFEKICSHYRLKPEESLPLLYGFGQASVAPETQQAVEQKLTQLRTITVFVRSGCPRCAAARDYLKKLEAKYPGIALNYRDVATDRTAQTEMNQVAQKYRQRGVSVPMFHFCNQVVIGWSGEAATARRLEGILAQWTYVPKPKSTEGTSSQASPPEANRPAPVVSLATWSHATRGLIPGRRFASCHAAFALLASAALLQPPEHRERDPPTEIESAELESAASADADAPPAELPLPGDSFDSLPLPGDVSDGLPLPGDVADSSGFDLPPEDAIDLPLFGQLRASGVGMPLLTIAVGLVDGFNPCAMWVLLFLLSVLVNLQSRWKILAVAGTFVVISGVAYFIFMACWLNIHSYIREAHETALFYVLGVMAVLISIVHIKDFFAFKQGVSLSIPEAAKPGIYARVRRIVTAENLIGAVIGAIVLAVIINVIELLCTAGLPALYTGILAEQGYPAWKEYAYIGLYNLAYMFDDSLMVGIVVVTLGKRKLQETQGRWLKLVSGVTILLLGLVMLFKPDLLRAL